MLFNLTHDLQAASRVCLVWLGSGHEKKAAVSCEKKTIVGCKLLKN